MDGKLVAMKEFGENPGKTVKIGMVGTQAIQWDQ